MICPAPLHREHVLANVKNPFDDVSWLVEYTHKGVRFAGGLVVGAVL